MTELPAPTLDAAWPALPLHGWRDTCETLHLWTQIVGKTRLALAPMQNHWWQVTLYVTPRGLTTSPIPSGRQVFSVELDFVDHLLSVRTSAGDDRSLPLIPQSVSAFYAQYLTLLGSLKIDVHIRPVPVELETATPFPEDHQHASYDAAAVARWWRVMLHADRLLKRFHGRFQGKASPVHFFWGGFDLASTRFSGRTAPQHPGGVPNCPDYVMHEAYSHECSSCGFWPGGGALSEPAFYAYHYPEPEGYGEARSLPEGAYYHPALLEYILPYEAVRRSSTPDETVLSFLQGTYETAADLARWDRTAMERPRSHWS